MNRNMYRVDRINRHNRNVVEMEQRHHNTKASKNQVVNSDEIKKNTGGPIIFDMPEIEGKEIDGHIVIKMGGRIMDAVQIQQWMETNYREYETAIREDLEVVPPL